MRKGIHMSLVNELKVRILAGGEISREEALQLFEEPVEEVARAADEIREKFCGERIRHLHHRQWKKWKML